MHGSQKGTLSAVRPPRKLIGMLIWISAVTALIASLGALLVKARAYLLAIYLWRKTSQLSVLRDVAEFECAITRARLNPRPEEVRGETPG